MDLCRHAYTSPNAELLQRRFVGAGDSPRLRFICGDSHLSLTQLEALKNQSSAGPDGDGDFALAFIDGYHAFDHALTDLRKAHLVARRGSFVIVDDCEMDEVRTIIVVPLVVPEYG